MLQIICDMKTLISHIKNGKSEDIKWLSQGPSTNWGQILVSYIFIPVSLWSKIWGKKMSFFPRYGIGWYIIEFDSQKCITEKNDIPLACGTSLEFCYKEAGNSPAQRSAPTSTPGHQRALLQPITWCCPSESSLSPPSATHPLSPSIPRNDKLEKCLPFSLSNIVFFFK